MRRYLNTLYITTEGAWLRKDGMNIVMAVDREERARIPVHMLGGVVCLGRVMLTPALMEHCAREGITVCFLDRNGRFQARVEGPVSGNVLLRREQYRWSDDDDACREIVRGILIGKVNNQRTVLRRMLRDHGDTLQSASEQRLRAAERSLTAVLRRLATETRTDRMRGREGEAASVYFGVFDDLIRDREDRVCFTGRSRRPPLDEVNALLSFVYTLLTHDCRSALEAVGLDPAAGFLHRLRPGRPSLALDLLEEFRPALADRLVLSLINRRQVTKRDFQTLDTGAVTLKDDARRTVLTAYQERKQTEIEHPFLDERATAGLLPHLQALLLARHIRGDLDAYPPYIWK